MRVARTVARGVCLAVALATHPSPVRPVRYARSRIVVRHRMRGGAGAPVRLVFLADPLRLLAQRPLLSHQLLHELPLLHRLRGRRAHSRPPWCQSVQPIPPPQLRGALNEWQERKSLVVIGARTHAMRCSASTRCISAMRSCETFRSGEGSDRH
jgi:hypothetical protein